MQIDVFERLVRKFAESAADAIVVADETGQIILINSRTQHLFGYEGEELLGKPIEVLVPERFVEQHRLHRAALVQNSQPDRTAVILEIQAIRKDGMEVPVEITLSPLLTNRGVFSIAVVRDVTEEPDHQSRVQQQERLAMLGTTAAVFAHEIANPLHGLSMCIEVVKKLLTGSAVTNPQALQAIAAASLEIERLTVLLKDYRTLSRPQSSNFELTDLRKLTADVLAPQLNAYKQLGVVFDTQFEADLPSITLEPVRMKQAILNLCQNAVEAMPDGGTLTLRSYVSEKQMIIEVSDSGIGIPDGLDVFQPFKTTKRDGTGLGLPIVRQIVTDHKGTVDYVSEIGKGTAFRIMLPINNGLLR